MIFADVVIVPCEDYFQEHVDEALAKVLEPIGGLSFVKPGMKVAIKANLVSFMKPQSAATTHPALLCSLVKMLINLGAEVTVGDSPGGLYNKLFVGKVYSATGVYAVEELGGKLNWNFEQSEEHNDNALIAKDFLYTAYLKDFDAVIDFCKLKTHGMMAYSGAAKNLFGVIPGTVKPEYHFRYPNVMDFANMIVDLDEFVKPVLSIIDGVVGMEGNGPTMGTPRQIGIIGASLSPHKLDLAAAYIIGLRRENVPTLQAAYERGLIPASVKDMSINVDIDNFVIEDFKRIENYNSIIFKNELPGVLGKAFGGIVNKALCSVPVVSNATCIGCAKCEQICPAKAIHLRNNRPKIDRSQCIHCFCCQEFCPKGALSVKRPIIARILNK